MLFLSIRPEYVEKIFRGEKQVELRRRRPRSCPGDWIAVYSTMPLKELVGIVQVADVRVAHPDSLWRNVRQIAGLSRSDYASYFDGAKRAIGIMLENPILLSTPIPLDELRQEWPDFQPPQGFRYLADEQIEFVIRKLGKNRRRQMAA